MTKYRSKTTIDRFYIKLISYFLLIIFPFSSVAWSEPLDFRVQPDSIPYSPLVREITVPGYLGSIQEVHIPEVTNSQVEFPTIVEIQDAHTSFQAQRQIRDLIAHLHREYGFNLLLLEGGGSAA